MYTTEEDARKAGWEDSGRNDGTLSHPKRDERILLITGDTGQVYFKDLNKTYMEKYDPSIHGTPND